MLIGVPKEIKTHEYRVGLTPDAVREYVAAGHRVVVEKNAGAGIGASDDLYRRAGALIAGDASEIFATAEMVVKSKNLSVPSGCSCEPTRSSSRICIWLRTRNRPRAS
jgi:alanine dehydrogenase